MKESCTAEKDSGWCAVVTDCIDTAIADQSFSAVDQDDVTDAAPPITEPEPLTWPALTSHTSLWPEIGITPEVECTETTPNTSSFDAEGKFTDGVAESPDSAITASMGSVWLTSVKVVTPTTTPLWPPPDRVTTTLCVPVTGATSCHS